MKYMPPLSKRSALFYLSMPRYGGAVMCPRYVEGPGKAAYEKAWGDWLRSHEKRDWPDYMEEYVRERRNQQSAGIGEQPHQREQGESLGSPEGQRAAGGGNG